MIREPHGQFHGNEMLEVESFPSHMKTANNRLNNVYSPNNLFQIFEFLQESVEYMTNFEQT